MYILVQEIVALREELSVMNRLARAQDRKFEGSQGYALARRLWLAEEELRLARSTISTLGAEVTPSSAALRVFAVFSRALPKHNALLFTITYRYVAGTTLFKDSSPCTNKTVRGEGDRALAKLRSHGSILCVPPTRLAHYYCRDNCRDKQKIDRVLTLRFNPLADIPPPGVQSATVSEGARPGPTPPKHGRSVGAHPSPPIEHGSPSAESAAAGAAQETEPPRDGGRDPPNKASGGARKK